MANTRKVPKCTNCGARETIRSGQGWGSVKVLYDGKGKQIDVDTSRMNYAASTVIRCAGCKKVRRDVQLPSATIMRR